jgi:hypothetical protein
MPSESSTIGDETLGPPLDAIHIQRFDNLYNSTPSAILSLDTALEQIVDGTYRHAIEQLRHIFAARGEDAYKAAKNRLPQWTFGGTFAPTRLKDHLIQHSGLCHADIDHLDNLTETKLALMTDPHVVYCFTSPSGDGLKYGVRIVPVDNDETYEHAWRVLAAAHFAAYGVTWDPSGKDICRLCFVSWDPTCYINPNADVYPVPPPMVMPPAPPRAPTVQPIPRERRERYAQRGIATAVKIIEDSVEGSLHEARCRAGYLLGGYVGGGLLTYGEAYDALRSAVEGHTTHLAAALKTIADCLKAGEAEPITLEELETDWQQWKAAHPTVTRAAAAASILTGPRTLTTPITGRPLVTAPLMGRPLSPVTLGEYRV